MTTVNRNESLCRALEAQALDSKTLHQAFDSAVQWMMSSGIHNMTNRPRIHGAINSWYDAEVKIYPYAYSEVAGYAIKLFVYLHGLLGDDRCLKRAEATLDWIRNNALEPNTSEIKFRFYYHLDDFSPRHAYAFDTGIILNGVANLYYASQNDAVLHLARELGHWLTQVMQHTDGSFSCVFDMEDRIRLNSPDTWSKQPGPYHTKIAAALVRLAEVTGDTQFEEAARRNCEWAMAQQHADGRFVSKVVDDSTITHPHCYACEGLLYVGLKTGEQKYIDASVKGLRWLLDHQREDGGIPAEFKEGAFLDYVRTDALAQTLRLTFTAFGQGHLGEEHLPAAARMLTRLLDVQSKSTVGAERGGFHYLYRGDGIKQPHLNSWASMFAIQAIRLSIECTEGRPLTEPDHLL